MHELGITRSIVAICEEQAEGRRVEVVRLEIGRLSGVMPDAIRFCFDLVAEGTAVEGATLEIEEVRGLGRCRVCKQEVALEAPFGTCQNCDGRDIECVAGQELRIREMEVV